MSGPLLFNLYQNFPNPFNSSTSIKYEIFKSGLVKIVIINSKGEEVRSIINKYHHVGEYSIQWDGTDSQGINMASGIYFYKIISDGRIKTQKMIYLK